MSKSLGECADYILERFPNAPPVGQYLMLLSHYSIHGDGKTYTDAHMKEAVGVTVE